jgi:hypothetical protein
MRIGAHVLSAAVVRAIAEPRLNAWVSEALGSLNEIVCLVDYDADESDTALFCRPTR